MPLTSYHTNWMCMSVSRRPFTLLCLLAAPFSCLEPNRPLSYLLAVAQQHAPPRTSAFFFKGRAPELRTEPCRSRNLSVVLVFVVTSFPQPQDCLCLLDRKSELMESGCA